MLKSVARELIPERWHWCHYCPPYLVNLVRNKTGVRVHKGPFKGLKYIDYSLASVYVPKLLGTYEQELHPFIEKACLLGFDNIIDVGAAEGYYAVGMAMRVKGATVTAFEMEESGREAVKELAERNGLSHRVKVFGKCEIEDLRKALSQGSRQLVICDVEGYEETLLDEDKIPALKTAYILVELHDFVNRKLSDIIRNRFSDSHHIELIWQRDRTAEEFPFKTMRTSIFPRVYIENQLAEFRPERMSWFWMEPK